MQQVTPPLGAAESVSGMDVGTIVADDAVAAAKALADERRAVYNRGREPDDKSKARKPQRQLPPAIDDLINAGSRGFNCRRKPITLSFSNDERVWDHMDCDDRSSAGCARCAPKPNDVCCDLCSPDTVSKFSSEHPPAKKAMKKASIKPYEPTVETRDLWQVLLAWRNEAAHKALSASVLNKFGSEFFIAVKTLKRIVDCAQAGKLNNLETLRLETSWRKVWVDEYGPSLLEKVHNCFPINIAPKLASEPGSSRALEAAATNIPAANAAGTSSTTAAAPGGPSSIKRGG
ncbi:hypothetical protein GLOTRDRAFT_134655 [Gloeophyllum trabeum ATCC 11539]|uniref:Uncharacterized protein n=1 Tax=Gloeophyllum trabeum (strain ATCC 11539 / FP-39264 / Madison 617) TaxID=670483 RepID=S7PPF2_GLOTA|nr:uncharacterized protein GLOTRDRAFT_134655 [Gloeophyllum trabeum ATCC 11539]EPQ49751.1 hypothetical protein GLOTRDRAFT_134655 [Gloeophyllum trabeum ATCC 11539]